MFQRRKALETICTPVPYEERRRHGTATGLMAPRISLTLQNRAKRLGIQNEPSRNSCGDGLTTQNDELADLRCMAQRCGVMPTQPRVSHGDSTPTAEIGGIAKESTNVP